MSSRARAVGFGAAALACAGLAAAMTSGYRADLSSQLGPLRPVVVATRTLPAHRLLGPAAVKAGLETRRVPARFLPPGALSIPEQALGQEPAAPIPAGGYLLAGQLRPPGGGRATHRGSRLAPGRTPVELAVSAAGALAASEGDPPGGNVDVIVTTEPQGAAARGRTYVAASRVRLLDLRQSGAGDPGAATSSPIGAGGWTATLALTHAQALKLIQAESYAREIRLIASG
jgi:Flp pilus assembly protein CpaB